MSPEKSLEDKVLFRLEDESEKIQQLQERWDIALTELYKYFDIEKAENDNDNEKLREIESKTIQSIDVEKTPIVLGFAGPGGAGKGTVRGQIKEPLNTGDVINSTTRDKRDYEIDGEHYNFVTTKRLAEGTILKKESLKVIQKSLDLEKVPEFLEEGHLDEIQSLIDEKFQKGEIEDGIDLFPDVENHKNEFLNLTLRPLRGWYALSVKDLKSITCENSFSSFEESAPNMLKIGEGVKAQGVNFYLIYVLPEQPIAKTMATRALKRDGVEQNSEKLLSTIGGRQILEFEKMVQMLVTGEYSTKLVLLVNDEGYEKEGEFFTRTGDALIQSFK